MSKTIVEWNDHATTLQSPTFFTMADNIVVRFISFRVRNNPLLFHFNAYCVLLFLHISYSFPFIHLFLLGINLITFSTTLLGFL